MTPQEQELIDGLINRIRSTPVQDKDTQAEQHIQSALANNSDALYVLVQTVLVQQYGLQQAQAQLNELKQQLQTMQEQSQNAAGHKTSSGSFLSHIFGGGSQSQQTQPPQQQGYQPVNNPGYGVSTGSAPSYPPPPPPYQQAAYPPSGGGLFGGGGGGFLRGAMQTAAGVAAGELAFQGMEDLFHGFGGGGRERGFDSGTGETVVNNYYGDDNQGDRDRNFDSGSNSDFYNPSDDASRNDLSGFDPGNDSGTFDNASSNDLGFDDNSSGDGGFDMGGGGDDFSGDNS